MKGILLMVPDEIKQKLDVKREQGYSVNGWLRALLARELSDTPKPRRPRRKEAKG